MNKYRTIGLRRSIIMDLLKRQENGNRYGATKDVMKKYGVSNGQIAKWKRDLLEGRLPLSLKDKTRLPNGFKGTPESLEVDCSLTHEPKLETPENINKEVAEHNAIAEKILNNNWRRSQREHGPRRLIKDYLDARTIMAEARRSLYDYLKLNGPVRVEQEGEIFDIEVTDVGMVDMTPAKDIPVYQF